MPASSSAASAGTITSVCPRRAQLLGERGRRDEAHADLERSSPPSPR
jgi:hypothetical protein